MSSWLQPPRLRIGEESAQEHRHATWLKLFYDLVFVVAVSQVAHNLSIDVSITGFFSFVFLFIPLCGRGLGQHSMPIVLTRSKYRFVAALLIILAIAGVGLSPLVIIALVAVVCATQVVQDLYQSGQLTFQ